MSFKSFLALLFISTSLASRYAASSIDFLAAVNASDYQALQQVGSLASPPFCEGHNFSAAVLRAAEMGFTDAIHYLATHACNGDCQTGLWKEALVQAKLYVRSGVIRWIFKLRLVPDDEAAVDDMLNYAMLMQSLPLVKFFMLYPSNSLFLAKAYMPEKDFQKDDVKLWMAFDAAKLEQLKTGGLDSGATLDGTLMELVLDPTSFGFSEETIRGVINKLYNRFNAMSIEALLSEARMLERVQLERVQLGMPANASRRAEFAKMMYNWKAGYTAEDPQEAFVQKVLREQVI